MEDCQFGLAFVGRNSGEGKVEGESVGAIREVFVSARSLAGYFTANTTNAGLRWIGAIVTFFNSTLLNPACFTRSHMSRCE